MNNHAYNNRLERTEAALKLRLTKLKGKEPKDLDAELLLQDQKDALNEYIDELRYAAISTEKEIFVVSKATFDKRVESADFSIVESDGRYHGIALVSNFPATECYLVWFTPLADLF